MGAPNRSRPARSLLAEYRVAGRSAFDPDAPAEAVHLRRGTRARVVFLPGSHRDDAEARREFAERFSRPPKVIGPRWVKVYRVESGEFPVGVKEFLPGRTLPQWLAAKPRGLLPRLGAAGAILAALSEREKLGAPRPELRPDEIFLGPDVAVILDPSPAGGRAPRDWSDVAAILAPLFADAGPVSAGLDALLVALRDPAPDKRPASAKKIRSALTRLVRDALVPGRPPRPAKKKPAARADEGSVSPTLGHDPTGLRVLDGVYRLDAPLGSGGMGEVWRAVNLELKREEAVKLIRREFADSDLARKRFRREARAAARLEHPNVVDLRRVGECDGVMYLVMPLLAETGFLDRRLKGGARMPTAEALWVAREVACALAAAHNNGLVHRDIKPGNLWLEADPAPKPGGRRFLRCKVLDFGLARFEAADGSSLGGDATPRHGAGVVGTPEYMAPEQARGEAVDHRADLFGLGAVLYKMLAGSVPFPADSAVSILAQVLSGHPPVPPGSLPLDPPVPRAASDLVMWMMAHLPGDRPQSALEVIAKIDALMPEKKAADLPAESSPWRLVAGVGAGMLVGLILGLIL